jgi:hypothetical protein
MSCCPRLSVDAPKGSALTNVAKRTEKSFLQARMALRYRTGRVKAKTASQIIEKTRGFEPENLSAKPLSLRCERVNDSTFKITDGELTNVPASHGQWAGYRITKALAWIIKLEAKAWLARCGDQVCGPSSFVEAKANAFALAKGADGDYFVRNAISHLNGLQARLLNTDEDSASD